MSRSERLRDISTVIVDNVPISKLDLIALIHIEGHHVLNVYRRYNAGLNIVVESTQTEDLYFFSNQHTIRDTILQLYGLRPLQRLNFSTQLYSFSFQSTLPHGIHMEFSTWATIIRDHAAIILHIQDPTGIFWYLDEPETPPRIRTPQASPPRAPLQNRSPPSSAVKEPATGTARCLCPAKRTFSELDATVDDWEEDQDASQDASQDNSQDDSEEYLTLRSGKMILRSTSQTK